jgi:hypothetical protein
VTSVEAQESLQEKLPDIGSLSHLQNGSHDRTAERLEASPLKIAEPPVQRGKLTTSNGELTWAYQSCLDDHFLDFSGYYPTGALTESWAYTEIESEVSQNVTVSITSNSPFALWLNDEHLYHQHKHFAGPPGTKSASIQLAAGRNRLLVRMQMAALRATSHLFSLRLENFNPGSTPVHIPIAVDAANRYQLFEEFFQQLYLARDVYTGQEKIVLCWPTGLQAPANYAARLQRIPNRIYAEAEGKEKDSGDRIFAEAAAVPTGDYEVVMMPGPNEFYHQQVRYQRTLPLVALRTEYSSTPYATYTERRQEALRFAAHEEGLFAEIAKMAGGWWKDLRLPVIEEAIARVNRREDGSNLLLLGLLGMLGRFGESSHFPETLLEPLADSIQGYRFAAGEPGSDAMDFHASDQRLLFYTCQLLAGERFSQQRFSNSGLTGAQQQDQAREGLLAWLEEYSLYGFEAWDTPGSFALHLIALSHLVDLAQDDEVWEMSSVVMDKIFLALALNSYQGVCGSSRRYADAASVKSGHLSPTAGVSRLMWGMGIWNQEIAGPVSLACCQNYDLPPIIAAIAGEPAQAPLWSTERHQGKADDTWEVHKVAYKTAHYLLAAAQDYRPGEAGQREHIWQATLGPDAIVFTNHPACMSESDAVAPGFWRGNRRLPRVAQWQDLLIAIYQLTDDDPLGFTHAYFPTFAFDEYELTENWAFARKGDGYLALAASAPFHLITEGRNAFREVRAPGHSAVWLCQMGDVDAYGSFDDFCSQMRASRPQFSDLAVACQHQGRPITFGWDAPLTIDGQEQSLRYERHYDGRHCVAEWPATEMIAALGEDALRIAFSTES